jgi:hypothetical protein
MKNSASVPSSSARVSPALAGLGKLVFGVSLFLIGAASGRAENPWGSGMGWSSWDSTSGGMFGSTPWESQHESHHVSHSYSHSFSFSAPGPVAIHDASIDPVMIKAGNIAEHRVQPHSTSFCWRYVKEALVAAGGVYSYPQTAYAREAGQDLVQNHGFVKLAVSCAERAPVGSVLVYGGSIAGHVELRTAHGFVSDYYCNRPSGLPFIGAYTRLEKHHKDTAKIASGVIVARL